MKLILINCIIKECCILVDFITDFDHKQFLLVRSDKVVS